MSYSNSYRMNSDSEIRRLLDIMPASGRMKTKIVSQPQQATVIDYQLPLPWTQERLIRINFELWSQLTSPQRDLIILSAVHWLTASSWLKPDWYQGLFLAGTVGGIVELVQGDAIGAVVAGGLSAIAVTQIRRVNRSLERELEADAAAIRVAQRRGYSEADAAKHLLTGIQAMARIGGQAAPTFNQLIRCQNLRAIAGLSKTGMPETLQG